MLFGELAAYEELFWLQVRIMDEFSAHYKLKYGDSSKFNMSLLIKHTVDVVQIFWSLGLASCHRKKKALAAMFFSVEISQVILAAMVLAPNFFC